jgi:SAM-dependent methyltransferase
MSGRSAIGEWLRAILRSAQTRRRVTTLEALGAERRIAALEAHGTGLARAHDESTRALLAEVRGGAREIAQLRQELASLGAQAAARHARHDERLAGLHGELLEAAATLARIAPPLPPVDAARGEWTDATYAEMFRGAPADIRGRLAIYLADVAAAVPRTGGGVVIDIGCGRGDWLGLLREEELPAFGIDESAQAVETCRAAGLDARQGDALDVLRLLPAASAAAVTAFHVVEHMTYPAFATLLVEAHRVLRPFGVLAIETPNCENLVVGASTFWLDPTHVRPYPPALLQFLVTRAGFTSMAVHRLHPDPAIEARAAAEAVAPLVRELLAAPQDVAIVALRPER